MGSQSGSSRVVRKKSRNDGPVALTREEGLFRSALFSATIGVAITDRQGKFVVVNPAFCRITGYPEKQLKALTWMKITHPKDLQKNRRLVVGMRNGEVSSFVLEKRYITKSGDVVWVRNSTSAFAKPGGKPANFIALVEDITERKSSEQAIHELSNKLLQSQDRERRRIARDLHDATGQHLAGLILLLGALKQSSSALDKASQKKIASALALARQAANEVRTISYLLHPPMLDDHGLVETLKWYVRGFSERSGITVRLHSRKTERLAPEAETALFRVVQESLNNVLQHSGSARADITIRSYPNFTVLTVRDYGNSGKVRKRAKKALTLGSLGVGIPGMRERLQQLGGELRVKFGRRGTTVKAILPRSLKDKDA
ncbi:MAG: hypothetical protein DMG65_03540 [Candidatus Angelobacter sp. Gp1-AA117]|nr:MAG: hypothetical protein DMG65_03540 [Candidatus Angelobacter sp. Gp1-AA117]